jgi:mRNA-degrading endonuclease RelE of RelBE toxin-antitoxin system
LSWELEISPEFERDYRKLCGRNAAFKHAVGSKVSQNLENPLRYKPLRAPLQGVRRVHVGGSYVLMFEPNQGRQAVRLLRLAHHDEAYGV